MAYQFILISRAVLCMFCSSYLDGFARWEISGHTAAVLWSVASRKQHVVFLCCYHQAFSPHILLASIVQMFVFMSYTILKPQLEVLQYSSSHCLLYCCNFRTKSFIYILNFISNLYFCWCEKKPTFYNAYR